MVTWHLYLVRTRFAAIYTGITTDVARRVGTHGGRNGAKYLRAKGPLILEYSVKLGGRSIALRAEARIKKLSRAAKEEIVRNQPAARALLKLLGLSTAAPGGRVSTRASATGR